MATTYTADAAQSYAPVPGHGLGGSLKVVTETYEVSTALVINDVIEMVRVPKGAEVVDIILVTDDLDTGTALTLDVGTGDDVDYFIAASTVGRAGGVARASEATAHPLTLSAEDTIDVHVSAAPTGGGTGTVSLTVLFKLP